jgi:hypothetical protein
MVRIRIRKAHEGRIRLCDPLSLDPRDAQVLRAKALRATWGSGTPGSSRAAGAVSGR